MTDSMGNSIEPSPMMSMEDTRGGGGGGGGGAVGVNNAIAPMMMDDDMSPMPPPPPGGALPLDMTDSMIVDQIVQQQQQQQQNTDPNNPNSVPVDGMDNSLIDVPTQYNLVAGNSIDGGGGVNAGDSIIEDVGLDNNDESGGGGQQPASDDDPSAVVREGGDAPPVELLADDAAQSRYQLKLAEEQLKQAKRTAVPLAMSFQKYALHIGYLRDSGDVLTQRLVQLAELCSYNATMRSGMANCTRWLACLLDHMNVRAYRVQDNVAVPLINKFIEHFHHMRQELKTTSSALNKEDSCFKRLTKLAHDQNSRNANVEYQKAYSNYQNIRRERAEAAVRLEQLSQQLRTWRMGDVRQALKNFCHTELHYHCKAIETLTEAFQQVKSMDIDRDQQEFRRALNISVVGGDSGGESGGRMRRSPARTRSAAMRDRIRQARSRYMTRSQQQQQQQSSRASRAPGPRYDGGGMGGVVGFKDTTTAGNITAATVARQLHQVDTLIDQNQMRQNTMRYRPAPTRQQPQMQRSFTDVDLQDESKYRTEYNNRYASSQPIGNNNDQRYYTQYQQQQQRSQSVQPSARTASAPAPYSNYYGAADNSSAPTTMRRNIFGKQQPQQQPKPGDQMFDYLNQRLQAEKNRYDKDWKARNRFETEQFASMRQLPRAEKPAPDYLQILPTLQQQAAAAPAPAPPPNQNFDFTQPFQFPPMQPLPPQFRQQRQQQQQPQQQQQNQFNVRTATVRQNQQTRTTTATAGQRRTQPTTRETKTSFHVTDYDHGPVTIFPSQPQPGGGVDYSRTNETTSFHSHDINDMRAVPMPRSYTADNVNMGVHRQQQQQQQRRFSGGNTTAGDGGGGNDERKPIIYRNPEPTHLGPGITPMQRRQRPMSAGNPRMMSMGGGGGGGGGAFPPLPQQQQQQQGYRQDQNFNMPPPANNNDMNQFYY